MSDADPQVEVVYAGPEGQWVITTMLAPGSTVEQAIRRSGIENQVPGFTLAGKKIGIYAKAADLTTVVQNGDRIEIYRPLKVDPKEARRLRAGKKRAR